MVVRYTRCSLDSGHGECGFLIQWRFKEDEDVQRGRGKMHAWCGVPVAAWPDDFHCVVRRSTIYSTTVHSKGYEAKRKR
jgi:hypothetical protein